MSDPGWPRMTSGLERPPSDADNRKTVGQLGPTARLNFAMALPQREYSMSSRSAVAGTASRRPTVRENQRNDYLRQDQAEAIEAARKRAKQRDRAGLGLPDYL
jgi:hypothetical protein